jgi:hypothetical protein
MKEQIAYGGYYVGDSSFGFVFALVCSEGIYNTRFDAAACDARME